MTAPTPGTWTALDFADPFCEHIGGLRMMRTGDPLEPVRFGLRVEERHCNRLDFCHGGLLGTFLDISLGVCAIEQCGHDWGGPTIELNLTFLRGAPKGDWIESRVTLEHTTRSLIFARGTVVGGAGQVALGSAIFKQPR